MKGARGKFNKESPFAVHEDFTDWVKVHRKELGKRLVQERQKGSYTSLNYDKLIVENSVYGYDEDSSSIYRIGRAHERHALRHHAHGATR